MNRIFHSIVFLMLSLTLMGQNASDALRYSMIDVGGTARTIGIAGAIGALGADFTTVGTNPAGLAAFRRSELTITPSLYLHSVSSNLQGNGAFITDKNNFNINNIGVVISKGPSRFGKKWKTSNVAFGMNRIANFNEEFRYEGATTGSMADRFAELANNGSIDDFEVNPAIETTAIHDFDEDGIYTNDNLEDPGNQIQKLQSVKRSGSINEVMIGMAGNYDEKLYIGGTIGIPIVTFKEDKRYTESDPSDDVEFFDNLSFSERLKTTGAGVNFKLGLIFRVSQEFRLGGAVHTPTAYTFQDDYSTNLTYQFTDAEGTETIEASSPDGQFDYDLSTPWKFIGSAAYIFGKNGFLSAEVEFLNYTGSKFNLTRVDNSDETRQYEQQINDDIDRLYQGVANVKLGGEFAYEIFRFRGGVKLLGSPYLDETGFTPVYTAGFGFREKGFFLDFAYTFGESDKVFNPYVTSDYGTPEVTNEVKNSQLFLTLGFKF